MIIIQLTGGLGNQLFQYAFAKKMAKINETSLLIDLEFFKTYEWHEYSLKPFNIEKNYLSSINKILIDGLYSKNKLIKHAHKFLLNIFNIKVLDYSGLKFVDDLSNKKGNLYLKGYFQSEKYFLDISEEIKNDFEIILKPQGKNLETLERINNCNSVSLHVRRGNYVSVSKVSQVHGTCSVEYYENAVKLISEKIENPVFFVFSDDIEWAKENIKLDYSTVYIDFNDDKSDYEDLRLMSNCQHNIIANSTFSWWGAWLNKNKSKIIISPSNWFNDDERNQNNIIPENWIKI